MKKILLQQQEEADIKKGQRTAIFTGAISIILGVSTRHPPEPPFSLPPPFSRCRQLRATTLTCILLALDKADNLWLPLADRLFD